MRGAAWYGAGFEVQTGSLLRIVQTISESLIFKVENILKDRLDSIPSPSPSVKIQIMGGKDCLRCYWAFSTKF